MLSHFSHVQPFVALCTVARQAPLSMGFSRQGHSYGRRGDDLLYPTQRERKENK